MAPGILASEVAAKLAAHLLAARGRDFQFGVSDCCLWVADWVWLVNGADPAADLRGTYGDRAGAEAVLAAAGGMAAVAARAGWAAAAEPQPGDIGSFAAPVFRGVRELPEGVGEVLAIRVEGGWAFRALRGLGFVRAPLLTGAWACPKL